MIQKFSTPDEIAKAGMEIYERMHKAKFEAEANGQYVAVSLDTEKAYTDSDPDIALEKALQSEPKGLFHLIRIGSAGAFKLGYVSGGQNSNWFI